MLVAIDPLIGVSVSKDFNTNVRTPATMATPPPRPAGRSDGSPAWERPNRRREPSRIVAERSW
jgi:hypothetical protein